MDEASSTSTFANDIGEYESRPYEEPIASQSSDKPFGDSKAYVVVKIHSAQERVTVWTAPRQERSARLARFANRVLAGEREEEDEVSSD